MDIKQRRTLTDLYARGEEISLGEGEDAVQVWIRKMTPTEAEKAYLRANSRRSSTLAMGKEEEPSALYTMLVEQIDALDRENLIAWVAATDILKKSLIVEAEVAGNPEWSDENYLISLQERFADPDFQEQVRDIPDDPEVKRIISELERFEAAVAEARDEAEKVILEDLDVDSDEELRTKVLELTLGSQADTAWLHEFSLCQIWLCTFWADNHKERVFPTRQDVDEVQAEVVNALKEAIERIHVGDMEGKD